MDRALLMKAGRVHATGATADVVAPGPVRAVYGVELLEADGLGYRLPSDGGAT